MTEFKASNLKVTIKKKSDHLVIETQWPNYHFTSTIPDDLEILIDAQLHYGRTVKDYNMTGMRLEARELMKVIRAIEKRIDKLRTLH